MRIRFSIRIRLLYKWLDLDLYGVDLVLHQLIFQRTKKKKKGKTTSGHRGPTPPQTNKAFNIINITG